MPDIDVTLRVDLLAMEPLEKFTLRLKPEDIDLSKEIVIDDLIIQIIDNDCELWLFFVLYIFNHDPPPLPPFFFTLYSFIVRIF